MPSLLVIDDDALVLQIFRRVFQDTDTTVITAQSGAEGLELVKRHRPDSVILDIVLPDMSGLTMFEHLHRLDPKIPVIFITGHADVPMSVRAMKAGAVDFLTKPFRDQDLLDAVTRALEVDRKRRKDKKDIHDVRARYLTLTSREKQIMALVTDGLLNKQVAHTLGISEVTAKIHRSRVMRKMGAKSLADLVIMAEVLGVRGKPPQ